ncbi:MAG: hypothetical protein R3C03_09695 [Pirellulaceae bacterium]
MEGEIDAHRSFEIVGEYQPHKSGFNYEELGVRPHAPEFYR